MKFTSKKMLTVLIALLTALIQHDDEDPSEPPSQLPEYRLPDDPAA
jgi:hypothetical protein